MKYTVLAVAATAAMFLANASMADYNPLVPDDSLDSPAPPVVYKSKTTKNDAPPSKTTKDDALPSQSCNLPVWDADSNRLYVRSLLVIERQEGYTSATVKHGLIILEYDGESSFYLTH